MYRIVLVCLVALAVKLSLLCCLEQAVAQPLYDWSEATELHQGILWAQTSVTEPRYLSINTLRIDTKTDGISFYTTSRIDDWVENDRETRRQTTRDFLRECRARGMKMMAAVNADAWVPFPAPDKTPADLRGLAISDGTLVSPASGSPSLLINRSGEMSLMKTTISTDISEITTAVSGFQFALVDGQPVSSEGALHPRTGFGLSQDRRFLYLMTIDGRRFSSQGVTVNEVGRWLAFFGAFEGLNMDGGGSTSLTWWNSESNDAELLNAPNSMRVFNPDLTDEQNRRAEQSLTQLGLLPNERANGNNFGIYFVEIHPDDAHPLGIESGDVVRLTNDDVLIQTGGFNRVEEEEIRFSWLEQSGHIRIGRGQIDAVAMVTPAVRPGVLFTYFLFPKNPFNALAHRVVDPITNNYRYKLAKARLTRLGESPYKHDPRFLTFQRRDFAGEA